MVKRFIVILSVLLIGSGVFVFLRGSDILPSGDKLKPRAAGGSVSGLDKASRVALHPLAADWETVEAAQKQQVNSFDDWARKTVEIGLALDVLYGLINTPEELASLREEKLTKQLRWATSIEAQGCSLPKYPYEWPKLPPKKLFDYEGPQTAEALMAEYDQRWLNTSPPRYTDWDAHYPKAAWIDRIVSMGGKFQEMRDYDFYLKLRGSLIRHKGTPNKWRSGAFGIPPTTNFEKYESAYINRKIWENDMRKKVRAAHPDEPRITTFFPSSQPDKYLPVVGNMTYVYRKPNSSAMRTYGTILTDEQSANLRDKGIEPEGIEIIYIDDEYNVLTEKPEPYNHQEWLEKNTYLIVPEGLRDPDGTLVSPERYHEITREEMPYETRQRYDEYVGAESSIDLDAARREAARAAAEASQATAKVEYEKFQNRMRQLEEFATMSDAEIEKKLERQFRKQFLPELPVEQLEQITPKRLERALGTLFQYGYEDGMRRIREDNATLADLLERHFGKRSQPPASVPKNPQRPVPPKPAETTDTPTDTE